MSGHVARAEIEVKASAAQVWAALTDPDKIEQYMFGTRVDTDWQRGSPITWRGEYEGRAYEDRGKILEIEDERRLKVTHFSPLTGQDDVPENYHTVTYDISERDGITLISLTQDNNASAEAAEHSRANWEKMLAGLKDVVEAR